MRPPGAADCQGSLKVTLRKVQLADGYRGVVAQPTRNAVSTAATSAQTRCANRRGSVARPSADSFYGERVSPQLLIVEDDRLIGASLERALEASGYRARWTPDGAGALAAAREDPPDLVLLDLGLPDTDGVDLARTLLDLHPGLPVIMLTARTEEADVVTGLHAGAVDYVTKPFRLAELLARVQAHLRTAQAGAALARVVTVGDLRLDLGARRMWVKGVEVDLRAREFDLLARLAREPGQVLTRTQLLADVWDEHWYGSTKTLDVHVAGLRRRLGERPGTPSRITALRGVGYRLEAP